MMIWQDQNMSECFMWNYVHSLVDKLKWLVSLYSTILCVIVAFVTQHALRTRHIVSCDLFRSAIFFQQYLKNGTIFEEFWNMCSFNIFSKTSS